MLKLIDLGELVAVQPANGVLHCPLHRLLVLRAQLARHLHTRGVMISLRYSIASRQTEQCQVIIPKLSPQKMYRKLLMASFVARYTACSSSKLSLSASACHTSLLSVDHVRFHTDGHKPVAVRYQSTSKQRVRRHHCCSCTRLFYKTPCIWLDL